MVRQTAGARLHAPAVVLWVLVLAAACSPHSDRGRGPGRTIVVPRDARTIQAAVRMANPGDVVLLRAGTYPGTVRVPKERDGITIRGVDRNTVVFDGEDVRPFAVLIEGDDVTLENFTAHNFRANAIEWENVEGFRGRFLTVWNVGGYGVYAVGSRDGRLDHSLVSGAANSAFYIGECQPCRTVLTDLEARLSGIGYSGTNAGGGLVVRDSVWIRNGTGLLPNSFNEERHAPQRGAVFMRNRILGSGTVPVPATDPLGGFSGLGIGIAGGQENRVTRNVVAGSDRYGIALFPTLQRGGGTWAPAGNSIRANIVRDSGLTDLAVSSGSGRGNCFGQNRSTGSLPREIERRLPCGRPPQRGVGDSSVARLLAVPAPTAYARSGTHPSYRDMPPPPPQLSMPR